MRYWNRGQRKRYFSLGGRFVSYLWGIETCHRGDSVDKQNPRLYLTYEVLKPGIHVGHKRCLFSLYLTYEVLKRQPTSRIKVRIYEFVSYLWGIETSVQKRRKGAFLLVCILPMRYWNQYGSPRKCSIYGTFVSYLWGIETSNGDVSCRGA